MGDHNNNVRKFAKFQSISCNFDRDTTSSNLKVMSDSDPITMSLEIMSRHKKNLIRLITLPYTTFYTKLLNNTI